ncbi:SymE family type I addiction module toxin [Trinickia mobilis]|uniref:SymE family type I addiction module toxin n=1 Tax=Trinickia mobilis TaxID=2816356 RepID=UPI001A8BF59B|nr:SymE family type I addiction module toxin [Trinickia mobilis]
MADAYLNARPYPAQRFVTIQQSRRYRPIKLGGYRTNPPLFPWFRLSGRWLERAGFSAGQRLSVEIHHGRLIITRT